MDEPYPRHRPACYWKKISPSVWQWSIGDIGCGFRDITVVRNPKLPASPLIRSEWTAVIPTNQAAGFYRHTTSNSITTESASSTATLFCKHRHVSIVKSKLRQLVRSGCEHDGITFLYQCSISQAGLRTRQASDTRELAADCHSRTIEETASHFAKRCLPIDFSRQFFRKTLFGQSPKVSELWLVNHFGRYDDHRRLEFIDCERESFSIGHSGLGA